MELTQLNLKHLKVVHQMQHDANFIRKDFHAVPHVSVKNVQTLMVSKPPTQKRSRNHHCMQVDIPPSKKTAVDKGEVISD